MKRFWAVVLAAAGMIGLAGVARADDAVLRWAGDDSGGAPYVFEDPNHPGQLIGFEKDLVEAIAKRLNKKAEFVSRAFDNLVVGLDRDEYDVAICGLEITDEHKDKAVFSLPYYATAEQITVRYGKENPRTLDEMRGKTVATLSGALSESLLNKYNEDHGHAITVKVYKEQGPAYQDLILDRVDAVFMDFPIALYSADPKRVSHVGEPLGFMQYGIAMLKSRPELKEQIDKALSEVIQSGEAREIYQRWGLWNDQTKQLFTSMFRDNPEAYVGMPSAAGPKLDEYRKAVYKPLSFGERMRVYLGVYLPLLIKDGVPATLKVSMLAMVLAIAMGLALAIANLYGPLPVRWLARAYIELVRGTPLLVQLYLIYFGLPLAGLKINALMSAVIGLGLNYAAYEAENYRAGLLSVHRGQMEAALALGMHRGQALWHVVVPQALRLTIPPVTNDFVALLKDSSIVSIIGMTELTLRATKLAQISYDWIGIGLLTGLVYFAIGLPFVRLARYAEAKLAGDKKGKGPSTAKRWFGGGGAKPAGA